MFSGMGSPLFLQNETGSIISQGIALLQLSTWNRVYLFHIPLLALLTHISIAIHAHLTLSDINNQFDFLLSWLATFDLFLQCHW